MTSAKIVLVIGSLRTAADKGHVSVSTLTTPTPAAAGSTTAILTLAVSTKDSTKPRLPESALQGTVDKSR